MLLRLDQSPAHIRTCFQIIVVIPRYVRMDTYINDKWSISDENDYECSNVENQRYYLDGAMNLRK